MTKSLLARMALLVVLFAVMGVSVKGVAQGPQPAAAGGDEIVGTATVGSTVVGKVVPNLLGISWSKSMFMKSYCPLCDPAKNGASAKIVGMLNAAGIRHLRILTMELNAVATYVPGAPVNDTADNRYGDADLKNFAAFVCAVPGLTFSWGINYVGSTPAAAAAEAVVLNRLMGPQGTACAGRLNGFEIGNEPDGGGYPKGPDGPAQFAAGWKTFAVAVKAAVPGVALVGPSLGVTNDIAIYMPAFLAADGSLLGRVTQHYYDGSSKYPNVQQILEPAIDPRVVTQGTALKAISAAHGNMPIEINEANTVPNGGVTGVSNSTASALWAVTNAFDFVMAAYGAGPVTLDYMSGGYPPYAGTFTRGYSPIVDQPNMTWSNPELTGMKMVSWIGAGEMRSCTMAIAINVRCFQVGAKTVLVNQSEKAARVEIRLERGAKGASSIVAAPPVGTAAGAAVDLKVQGGPGAELPEAVVGKTIVTEVPALGIKIVTEMR